MEIAWKMDSIQCILCLLRVKSSKTTSLGWNYVYICIYIDVCMYACMYACMYPLCRYVCIAVSCLSGWVKSVLKNPFLNSSVHNQHFVTTKIKEDLNQENKAALSSILVLVTKTSYKALPWLIHHAVLSLIWNSASISQLAQVTRLLRRVLAAWTFLILVLF